MIVRKWGVFALIVTGSTGAAPLGATDAEQAIRQKLNISTDERAVLDQGKAIAREVKTNRWLRNPRIRRDSCKRLTIRLP